MITSKGIHSHPSTQPSAATGRNEPCGVTAYMSRAMTRAFSV